MVLQNKNQIKYFETFWNLWWFFILKKLITVKIKSINGQSESSIEDDCLSKNVLLKMSSYDIFWLYSFCHIFDHFRTLFKLKFHLLFDRYVTHLHCMIKKFVICKKELKWKKILHFFPPQNATYFLRTTYVFSPHRNKIFLLKNFIHEWQFPPLFIPTFLCLESFLIDILYV